MSKYKYTDSDMVQFGAWLLPDLADEDIKVMLYDWIGERRAGMKTTVKIKTV